MSNGTCWVYHEALGWTIQEPDPANSQHIMGAPAAFATPSHPQTMAMQQPYMGSSTSSTAQVASEDDQTGWYAQVCCLTSTEAHTCDLPKASPYPFNNEPDPLCILEQLPEQHW